MNTQEITAILKKKCRRQFVGTFAYDRLPKVLPPRRPLLLVCNTDIQSKPGRHWITMTLNADGSGEFFDSLNEPVIPARFVAYLDKHCSKSWTRNERQIQGIISRFCGNYVIFYCMFKYLGYSMREIESLFCSDTSFNDALVHGLTCRR